MPKCEYPAYFENGLLGVRAKEPIKNREAFIYIPFKLLFTLNKVENNPILSKIISENPECFSPTSDGTSILENQGNLLKMTLGLFYEISLGQKGLWYPWLRQMLDVPFSTYSDSDLDKI